MGSTYSIALYGYDRIQMEAAADAAFDEVRRLDDCFRTTSPTASGARSTASRGKRAGQGFAGAVPASFRRRVQPEYSRESEGRSISRSAR